MPAEQRTRRVHPAFQKDAASYEIRISRKPGFWEWFYGGRYSVTLYRGDRYVTLTLAGTLASAKRAGRQLVLDDMISREISGWTTTFDFESSS